MHFHSQMDTVYYLKFQNFKCFNIRLWLVHKWKENPENYVLVQSDTFFFIIFHSNDFRCHIKSLTLHFKVRRAKKTFFFSKTDFKENAEMKGGAAFVVIFDN